MFISTQALDKGNSSKPQNCMGDTEFHFHSLRYCRYTSQQNTGVKSALIADAKAKFAGIYSPARVKSKCIGRYMLRKIGILCSGSIHRYYEGY